MFRWNAADFRRFIESPRPAGCQTPLHILQQLLKGTDAYQTFEELTRGEPGGENNPDGANQYQAREVNRDNVTDEVRHQPPRDYSREAPTGNSVSYALRRLKRNGASGRP